MESTIKQEAFFNLSYGVYTLTANCGGKDNGCIINTVMQVTDSPKRIMIAVNKENYTNEMILNSKKFNISVLSDKAEFSLVERFGFSSGRDTDKFKDFADYKRSENGLLYITKGTNAFISADVKSITDCGTHTVFLGDVTEAGIISDAPALTYQAYRDNLKPKPAKKKGFVCKICGYVYEGDTLPEDYICPLCKHPASDFEPIE